MGPVQRPRNVRIGGKRTSMRLEAAFWDALEEIAAIRGKSVEWICEYIADRLHRGNLSSAMRVYVLNWWRRRPRHNAVRSLAEKLGKRQPAIVLVKRVRVPGSRKPGARKPGPRKPRA